MANQRLPGVRRAARGQLSRREFVAGTAALTAGYFVWVGHTAQETTQRRVSPGERVNIAGIGVGGRGADDLAGVEGPDVNIVALCDVDENRAAETRKKYPQAKWYSDFRKMLESQKDIDAVTIGAPDHIHAAAAIMAMKMGKHVYSEKPLAHSIYEARRMRDAAAEAKVATQMGTQGHAYEGSRQAVEAVRAGAIGEVRELHVWTDRPAGWWPQGVTRPPEQPPVPAGLDWDLWLGPAPWRPYNPSYVPFKWRGFWDFGTGAIGDMGIHNLDTAYWALELGIPTSAEVKDCSPGLDDPAMKETAPKWAITEIHFPARGDKPPVKMTWYDGGKIPPKELLQGEPLISKDGGSLAIGTKGTLFTRTWHGGDNPKNMYLLLPRKEFMEYKPPKTLPRAPDNGHHREWVAACKGGPMSLSNFAYASALTESLLLGNLALRAGGKIEWDSQNMKAKNNPGADQYIHPEFRPGWGL